MDCTDFELSIFTYGELAAEEKKQLNEHLQSCNHCRELFQQANEIQKRVGILAQHKALPPNAAKLTNKIMAEVNNSAKLSWQEYLEHFLQNRITKYSLSAISCSLLFLLLIEIIPTGKPLNTSFNENANGSVTLDSKVFRKSMLKKKNKVPSYADCRSPFRAGNVNIDCLKRKMK
jgi:predicted anti-sigma-YlaC factor YlaD